MKSPCLFLNYLYSNYTKHIPILDVFSISAGFLLRLIMGTIVVGISLSSWMFLCTFMLTLFLGFCKRRAEYDGPNSTTRSVLFEYTSSFLENIITATSIGAIICYSMYTIADETRELHSTDNLIYTTPLVCYAIFRYTLLVYKNECGEDPASDLIKDPHILITCIMWVIMIGFILTRV